MRYILLPILYALVIVVSYGCTEEIDMKFETGKPQLVVDAVFTDKVQDHYVILTVSAEFMSNDRNPPVTNAIVHLTDGYKEIELDELGSSTGIYLIPKSYRGIYGQTYTLNISGVDVDNDGVQETYSASNTLYPVSEIDAVGLKWSLTQGQKQWQVLLFTQEPEETKDYYAFTVYINGELITPRISENEIADDKYFNGNDVKSVWVQSIVEEDGDGELTEHILQLGDWVKLEMQAVNQDYYEFIDAVHQETGIKIPLFSGPPANVPTNISNGDRVFFRTYSLTQDSIEVTQKK